MGGWILTKLAHWVAYKNGIDFGDHDPFLILNVGKWPACALSPEGIDRF